VGTQSIVNVLSGERYKSITKETAAVLKGEYGRTPAPVNEALRTRVLNGTDPVTCRPADLLAPEVEKLSAELNGEKGIRRAANRIEDVLIYALFPQVGLRFLRNRDDPDKFEPPPWKEKAEPPSPAATQAAGSGPSHPVHYRVAVNGNPYDVEVTPAGAVTSVQPASAAAGPVQVPALASSQGEALPSPLTGTVFKVAVAEGQQVQAGDVVIVLEAMKMENEVRAARAGRITSIVVREGSSVHAGDALLYIA
jgi:oxaloacetate decarboxylase alpha subunit